MIVIKATFIGKHGSLGYEHGQECNLHTKLTSDKIIIKRADGTGICEYSTLLELFLNWHNPRVDKVATKKLKKQ